MKKNIAVDLLLLVLSLTACASQPNSLAIATLASTAVPLLTPIASTKTLAAPTATPDMIAAFTPQGQPASEWNGIPIMPGALTGEGDEEGYVFTIRATPQQIREFYSLELSKLGWQRSADESGDSSLLLIFMNSSSVTLTISIVTKGNEALVLLVN